MSVFVSPPDIMPPTKRVGSSTTTVWPARAAATAADIPPGVAPKTTIVGETTSSTCSAVARRSAVRCAHLRVEAMQAGAERSVVDPSVGLADEARLCGHAVHRAGDAFACIERHRQREGDGAGAEHGARLRVAERYGDGSG